MGFFSEINKFFKAAPRLSEKVTEGRRRILSDVNEEAKRSRRRTLESVGLGKPTTPGLPPLPAPPATPISGQGSDEIRRRQRGKVSGRGDTIVSGELSPKQVGKKTLLGR